MSSVWKLPSEIISRSSSNRWSIAVQEWKLDFIEQLEDGEESYSCLCGHYPIRELCHIINIKNNEKAIIGNHCIQRFDKNDPAHAVFGDAPKVFRSLKKILKDPMASASKATLDYAVQKDILTANQARGYEEDKRKRFYSVSEERFKKMCNTKLIHGIAIRTAKAAYKKLKEDPKTTAGPKLIEYAYEKKVFTKNNYDFYMKIWAQNHTSLTEKQKKYKVDLNNKIILQLKENFTDDIQIQRSSSSSSSSSSNNNLSSIERASNKKKKRKEDIDFNLIDLVSSEEKETSSSSKRSRYIIESDSED